MQYCSKIDAGRANSWRNASRFFFLTPCDQTGQLALCGRKKGASWQNAAS
jgi:hypothetical protein